MFNVLFGAITANRGNLCKKEVTAKGFKFFIKGL